MFSQFCSCDLAMLIFLVALELHMHKGTYPFYFLYENP